MAMFPIVIILCTTVNIFLLRHRKPTHFTTPHSCARLTIFTDPTYLRYTGELFERLGKKMGRTVDQIKGWIESVAFTDGLAG